MSTAAAAPSRRRPYLDWLRGVAVLCMIEWHSIDAWTRADVRDTTVFYGLMIIGGWAAPLFLFLAGVSVPLAGHARERRGATRAAASLGLHWRGWQIFGLAHLFRLQSFVLSRLGNAGALWSSILKPDILNILGLGLAGTALAWRRATTPVRAAVWLGVPAIACVAVTPFAPGWDWPTALYPRFEAYIRPVSNLGVFQLFPWAGYVFAGAWLGTVLAATRDEASDRAFHIRLAAAGGLMTATAWLAPPVPALSTFASNVGQMCVMLGLAWWWMRGRKGASSPLVLFGRTSLFVYWVHVELAYGGFSRAWRGQLPVSQSIPAFLAFAAAMWVLALAWDRLRPQPFGRNTRSGNPARCGPRSSV